MARVSKKRALKKTRTIDVPDFDSKVLANDLVLINRSGEDFNTEVDDLTQHIGDALNIEGIVEGINTNEESITSIEGDITNIQGDISKIEGDIGTINGSIGDINAIIGDGSGGSLPELISDLDDALAAHEAANEARNVEIVAEQAAQDSRISANEADIAANAAAIAVNETDIAALQGALVYRGLVANPSAEPPADPHIGDFYQFPADGSVNAAWNAPSNTVSAGDYYAFYEKTDGSGGDWGPAGSNAVVVADPGSGELSFTTTAGGLTVTTSGDNFNANSASAVAYAVALKLKAKDEGGLTIDADGNIVIDPEFIAKVSETPTLDQVLQVGGTSGEDASVGGFSATSVASSGAVTAVGDNSDGDTSSFLFKNIATLPKLGA